MPEPTLDLLTADGRQLMASVNPTWGEPEVFTERAYQKMAALRDAIVAAARAVPVALTEREVAEACDAAIDECGGEYAVGPVWAPYWRNCYPEGKKYREAFARRIAALARPSEAALREARREGWDAAVAFANEKWGITQRPEHWDAERDRRWPAPPKPTPSVTLSDGSVVIHTPENVRGFRWKRTYPEGNGVVLRNEREWNLLLCEPTDTGADFDAVKALAAQVAPERAK